MSKARALRRSWLRIRSYYLLDISGTCGRKWQADAFW
jgi:hypothetical protein